MTLYMYCDRTKYRLPLYVTDSIDDLARFSGKSVNEIKRLIQKAEKRGGESQFIKVELRKGEYDE